MGGLGARRGGITFLRVFSRFQYILVISVDDNRGISLINDRQTESDSCFLHYIQMTFGFRDWIFLFFVFYNTDCFCF